MVDESADRVAIGDLEMEEGGTDEATIESGEDRPTAMDREGQPAVAQDDDVQKPAGAGQSRQGVAVRRKLKLVLTLEPAAGDSYRVILALGAEGCDPLLRSTEAQDIAAALELVPALVAEGEERWQTQPRYPTARAAVKAKTAAPTATPAEAPPPREGGWGTPEAGQERQDPGRHPSTDQLSLF